MKKWIYFVVPIVATCAFLFVYFSHVEQAQLRAAANKAEATRIAAAETAKKKELEEKARIDAEQKAKLRAEADAAKEAARIATWQEQGKKIQDEMDEAIKSSSDSTAQIVTMEKEITALRAQRERLNRDFIETARAVELAKIARRNAELELDRLTKFIVKKSERDAALSSAETVPSQ